MNKSEFSYKLRASAELIEVNLMARGAVNLFTFYKPSRKTVEGLQKLSGGDTIEFMELTQVVDKGTHSDALYKKFEVMGFFPDVLHRKTMYHLLLKDLNLLTEDPTTPT